MWYHSKNSLRGKQGLHGLTPNETHSNLLSYYFLKSCCFLRLPHYSCLLLCPVRGLPQKVIATDLSSVSSDSAVVVRGTDRAVNGWRVAEVDKLVITLEHCLLQI